MPYQADLIGEPAAAYQTVWVAQPEGKADNRGYSLAALGAWVEVAASGPAPAFDLHAFPEQPVLPALAEGYLDLLG